MKRNSVFFLFLLILFTGSVSTGITAEKSSTDAKAVKGIRSKSDSAIKTIWLTHRSNDPNKIMVNWLSAESGASVVFYGKTPECSERQEMPGSRNLHHVEISVPWRDGFCYYKVQTGSQLSPVEKFQTFPTKILKVALVGNWHAKANLPIAELDQPHILMTAGDNISDTWNLGGIGNREDTKSYARLVDNNRTLFRTTPFMPILGNHDHEIRPRGTKFPKISSYDIDATVFCRFFPLPDDGWKWRFDVPDFNLSFLTLDLSHTYDFGTTWQPCHPFDEQSDQFQWYRKMISTQKKDSFVVTIYNERHRDVRTISQGIWHEEFKKGTTICLTGFGNYYERSETDGISFFNTSINGKGTKFPDPKQVKLIQEDNYLLLTFDAARKSMTVEAKDFNGKILDRKDWILKNK